MLDEILLQVMQLSKEDKLVVLQTLENDLSLEQEGYRRATFTLSNEDKAEIERRLENIRNQDACTIEFDDHVIHLQRS